MHQLQPIKYKYQIKDYLSHVLKYYKILLTGILLVLAEEENVLL